MTSLFNSPMKCPECRERIWREQLDPARRDATDDPDELRNWECPHCGIPIRIAPSYQWGADIVALQVAILLGWLTFSAESSGAWILRTLVLGMIARPLVHSTLARFFTPWLGRGKPTIDPVTRWLIFSFAFSLLLGAYLLVLQMAHVILGAHPSELQDNREMFSMPLAWLSAKHFLITSHSKLLDVAGILLGNALFQSIPMLACWWVVRRAFQRNATIRLELNDSDKDE